MGPRRLELISVPKARKATFQKRSRGISKKAEELAILCDANVCVVSSALGDPDSTSIHWPPESSEVQRILARFRAINENKDHLIGVRKLPMMKKKEMDPSSSSSSFPSSSSSSAGGGIRTGTGTEMVESLASLVAKIAEVEVMMDQLRKGKEKEEQQPPLSPFYQDPYLNFDLDGTSGGRSGLVGSGKDCDFDFDSLLALMNSEEELKMDGNFVGSLIGCCGMDTGTSASPEPWPGMLMRTRKISSLFHLLQVNK